MTTEQYPKVYLYRRIVQAKLFIDINYIENIDLDNISEEAYFSKFHFIRLFKKIYGKTPHQYLTSVRLEKAKQLLAKGLTVSEVCTSVGFESLSSFSSLFKNTFAVSPTKFISDQIERQAEMATNPLKFIPGCIATKYGWLKK
ncbi:MAG: helix-turn-helix transcriptional regulator [Ferruginibacter sp.]